MMPNEGTERFDRDALTNLVVRKIKAHHNLNDILLEVCNITCWDWKDAQRFVDQVTAERRVELISWEMRIYLVFGGAIAFVGAAMVIVSAVSLLEAVPARAILEDPSVLVGLTRIQTLFISMITGLGMTVGGIIGVIKAFQLMSSE